MVYLGAGTQSSPIAIDDDSEDEVVYQLSSRPQNIQYRTGNTPDSSVEQQQPLFGNETYVGSPSVRSWSGEATWPPDPHVRRNNEIDSRNNDASYPSAEMFVLDPYAGGKRSTAEFGTAIDESPLDWLPSPDLSDYAGTKKRKRTGSFTSQDMSMPGPSHPQPTSQLSLANRLSQPVGKKARKRRRRAERQAIAEARLQNSGWAENPTSSHLVSDGDPGDFPPYEAMDDAGPFDNFEPRESPPSPNDSWVSSMAMAAENSIDMKDLEDIPSRWSSLPVQVSFPPAQPPPPLPPPPAPKHSLPAKPLPTKLPSVKPPPARPPPPQPVQPIGMQPDQDPNSKHGIFHIEKSNKEAGTDLKKRNQNATYLPNPARTLVMEQLPKTHRNVEFIYKWSRSACGVLPVHLFIDPPSAKALVEFATAELARKAWGSPKLGLVNLALKSHQLKGKPREDQIKVWWYRVDGVGAGAGVGEIEEGEIEGDSNAGDAREVGEQSPHKETKKEKKARLAKEREERKKAKEMTLAIQQQSQQEHEQQQAPGPPSMFVQESQQPSQMRDFLTSPIPFFSHSSLLPAPLNALAQPFQPILGSYFPGMLASAFSNHMIPSWNQQPSFPTPTAQGPVNVRSIKSTNKTAFGSSMNKDGHSDSDSIASSTSPLLKIEEKETTAEVQYRPRGRPRTIIVTKSTSDVDDEGEDPENGMDVDDEPALTMGLTSFASLVQQPAPPKQAVGFNSLPAKPVLALPGPAATSQPQKSQSQPQPQLQPFTSSSFVTRNKSPPSPRHHGRDGPPHKKPQLQFQHRQQNLTTDPQSQAQSQSRPPTAPRSIHLRQQRPVTLQNAHIGHRQSTIIGTSSSSSSASGSARSTPIPSEPKAMRVQVPAPSPVPPITSISTAAAQSTSQPNMTKQALLARQKELAERIARSKEELAAATKKSEVLKPMALAAVANHNMNGSDGGGSFQHSSQVVSEPAPAPVRPAMDLGEKQAMEDRLRKKVLQSQKARAAGKLAPCGIQTSASESAPDSPILDPATTSTSVPRTLSAVSSATQPPLPENSMPARSDASHANEETPLQSAATRASSTVSMSSHSFSLEDLAVSFITQTIETYKSQPGTPTVPASVPMSLETPSHSSTQLSRPQRQQTNKLELAAKQRRLEQHIAESKSLMARLTQARSKEEKDRILKIMKEKSWLFEEANKTAALSDDNMASSPSVIAQAKKTELNFNSVSSSGIGSRTSSHSSMTEKSTMMTQFQIARWPVSRHDAGVLILSDDEDEDDDGDDEDGAA